MLAIGEVYIHVSDFKAAMTFWTRGVGLAVSECESSKAAAFAVLDFPSGGPSLRLLSGAVPWPTGQCPEPGVRPGVRFDIMTDGFDDVLLRVLEHGGTQAGMIETYQGLRVVTIADPDGNTFELIESPDTPS